MEFLTELDRALVYANQKHAGHLRKGTDIPYISHLLQVAGIVLEYGGNEEQAIAALLHDVVEDGKATLADVKEHFGDSVAAIVDGCTDTDQDPKPPWRPRKEAYIARIKEEPKSIRLVSAADKLHNARAIVKDCRAEGDALFNRFKAGKAGTLWYYRSLVVAFRDAGTNPALVHELDRVVTEMKRL